MSYTPGPWSEPCNFGASRFEVQGDGKQVAIVNKIEDAILVAAAPELLSALDLCEKLIREKLEGDGNSTDAGRFARGALAKATKGAL